MSPEERHLLERTLKLSEENNEILHAMRRKLRLAVVWSIIKIVILLIPFVVAYFYLQDYFGPIGDTFMKMRELILGL